MRKEKDCLQRFLFVDTYIRGALVSLDTSWQALLQPQSYPDVVQQLLGQLSAAGVLLSATLKFNGSLTIQTQGDGPISMMVVECTTQRTLRGVAKWQHGIQPGNLSNLFGSAQLAVTLDTINSKSRYQSMIELEGDTLAQTVEKYLQQSEQLATTLLLAASHTQSVGLLLQKLPKPADIKNANDDNWNRISQLAATLTSKELMALNNQQILHRLFSEDNIQLFDPEPCRFYCSCSRRRVQNMLKSLGVNEIHQLLDDVGVIQVDCEFCGQQYTFDKVDTEALFASDDPSEPPPTQH